MKKSLKLISALLAATASMTMIMTSTASANPHKGDKNIQTSQSTSVIKVSNIIDLNNLRELSNNGETFEGKTIILENDINITKDGTKNGDPVEFKTIFNKNAKFKGIFDGNGKTLNFNVTNSNIFGDIGEGGVIKNLNITGRFEGDLNGAILTMFNNGTIDNCQMDVVAKCTTTSVVGICSFNLKHGIIENCQVKGTFSTNAMSCAGICNYNCGTIKSCKVSGKLTNCAEKPKTEEGRFMLEETGAIASFNSGLVQDCHVEAELQSVYKGKFMGTAGGIVSTNNGLIENSTFKGSIAAGLPGGITSSNYGIVRSCKATNAKIEGPLAAEFTSFNMWGDIVFCEYDPIKNQPQGVIDSCEFEGSVSGCIEPNKIAAYDNVLSYEGSDGPSPNIPISIPKITNCKINGKDVIRKADNYYRSDAGYRDATDPKYKEILDDDDNEPHTTDLG